VEVTVVVPHVENWLKTQVVTGEQMQDLSPRGGQRNTGDPSVQEIA
jgi:hypothetical protein